MEEKEFKSVVETVGKIDAAVKSVADKVNGFEGSVKSVADSLEQSKTETETQLKDVTEALRVQSEAIKSIRVVQDSEEPIIESIKKAVSSDDFKTARANQKDFEFKVKLLTSDFSTLPLSMTSHVVASQVGTTPIPENTLTNLLTKGSMSARTLYYIDEDVYDWTLATRGVVAEAASKPPVAPGGFTEKSVSLVKVANSMRVSSEVLWDIPFVTSMIHNTLLRDLNRQVEWSILLGSGNANFKGLAGYAVAYVGTDLDGTITSPTAIDAVIAMALEMELKGFTPDVIVMAPEMYTSLLLMKDPSSGAYIGQQLLAMLSRFNIVTSVRFSNKIGKQLPKGHIYIIDSSRYNLYNDGSITIRAGYNADDWITNQQTFVAEQRWLDYMYTNDSGAIMTDSLSDVTDALNIENAEEPEEPIEP